MVNYFIWPIEVQLWEAEWSGSILAFRKLSTPTLTVTCILTGQQQRKLSESWQKDVKKLSRINQQICISGNGTTYTTITDGRQTY